MKTVRSSLHGLVLLISDLAGIAGGAVAAHAILGVANQVWLQLLIAVVVSIAFFLAWIISLRFLGAGALLPKSVNERVLCFFVALFLAPLVFVPLHYFTQGYLTSLGNLVGLAVYQLPVNSIALLGAGRMLTTHPRARQSVAPNPGPEQPRVPKRGFV